ncbi:MAB_1171c family putative transporter [Streptomyces sp. NPDC005279]|uniref:MAB_1171c family putative transporter n=1 Tax=Streptomyces sp. NPDC005279 TaxID=3364712 RepID=UPI00369FFDD0
MTLLHPLCTVTAWLALLYKLSGLRRARADTALIALCCVLGFSAVSFTVSLPVVWAAVDRLSGLPGAASLALQGSVMSLAAGQQVLLAYWMEPPERARRRAARRLLLTGAAVAGMFVLFLLIVLSRNPSAGLLVPASERGYSAAYSLLYNTVYGVVETEVCFLCWQYARVSHLWLRCGLLTTALGAVLTLSYSAVGAADAIARCAHLPPPGWGQLAWTCGDIGSLLKLLGWTLPGWGPQAYGVTECLRKHRQYRTLRPLWLAFYQAMPAIALRSHISWPAKVFGAPGLDFRLYRRVIEIRDGQLALRDRVAPGVTGAAVKRGLAAGLRGDDLQAVVQAAQLASALRARENGRQTGTDVMVEGPVRVTLADEIAWLMKVSEAFARSPIVGEALRDAALAPHTTADQPVKDASRGSGRSATGSCGPR